MMLMKEAALEGVLKACPVPDPSQLFADCPERAVSSATPSYHNDTLPHLKGIADL